MKLGRLLGLFFVTYCLILFGYVIVGSAVAYIMIAPEQDHLAVLGRILFDVSGSILKDSLIWLGGAERLFNFLPTAATVQGTAALRSIPAHALLQAAIFAVVIHFAISRRFTFGATMLMPVLVAGLTYSLLMARLTSVGGVSPLNFAIVFMAQYMGLLVGNGLRIFFRGHVD